MQIDIIMLSLLVISERFWPEGSGGALATFLITKMLATCGNFRVTVITGTPSPARINGVSFVIDEAFKISNKPLRWLYFLRPLVRERYKSLMRGFDIIYIPFGYPLIPLAKELDKRVIVHLHDYQPIAYNSTIPHNYRGDLAYDIKAELTYELFEHGSIKRAIAGSLLTLTITLCRAWVRKADTIICVSRRQAEIMSNLAPELAHRIRVVYNPLPEVPQIEEKFKCPTFTYTGGGSYVKGFHIFIKGALNILRRGDNVNFLLTGGLRGFRREHEKIIEKLNNTFAGRFRLLGRLPYEDVLKLYSRSHAVLVPSIWEEPLPYVVMEAMAMGTLPIASRVGGILEIVEGTPAENYLFKPGDPNDLTDKMESLLAMSNEQITNISIDLREAVLRKFSSEVTKEKLMDVFLPSI